MTSIARPVSEVLLRILDNLQEIVRSEARLATAELREEFVRSRKAIAWMAVGVLSCCFACGYVLMFGFYVLCRVLPSWAAAATIAVGCAAICLFSIRRARDERNNQ
jgi:Putative Actinobacterial Holin-X, holin superfamily III